MKILGKILCNIINYGFFGAIVAIIGFVAGGIVEGWLCMNEAGNYGYFTALCRIDGHKVIVKEAEEICKCDKVKTE